MELPLSEQPAPLTLYIESAADAYDAYSTVICPGRVPEIRGTAADPGQERPAVTREVMRPGAFTHSSPDTITSGRIYRRAGGSAESLSGRQQLSV